MLDILNSPEVLIAIAVGIAAGICILALRIDRIDRGGCWFK